MLKIDFEYIKNSIYEIENKLKERYANLNIHQLEKEREEIKKSLEDASIWSDSDSIEKAKKKQSRISVIDRQTESWKSLAKEIEDIKEYLEIAEIENEVSLLPEIQKKVQIISKKFNKLDIESILSHEDDFRNAFFNIHPGAGGTESQDWGDMLYRAYLRWAEKKKFQVEIIDYQAGEEAGIKNITLLIKGINSFGLLKSENGVHRLVRISPFDSSKKRHTSFVAIHVSPEISEDIKVDINEKDIRIDTYRSSGAGGQHVNKTDSAVRITHQPTGIVVACQNERSQLKNKSTAMKMLKARLYELFKNEKEQEIKSKSGDRKDISWGNQIRSYVFHPYNLVKDLRTNQETSNVQAVMDGDFDIFIDSYLRKL